MSWIQHIAYIKNKVSKGIGIMLKARTYLDRRGLINLYNAYIYPYLIYCVESWAMHLSVILTNCIFCKKLLLDLLLFLSIIKVCMYHLNLYLENPKFYNYIILYKTELVS